MINTILSSEIIGEGQPFIVLHGLFGMKDNWRTFAKDMSEKYQVHLIDLRNHGESFHSDKMSYSLMSDDLNNYINYYELENYIVLGHSMGGKTAMKFACNYNNEIEKLIIVDISPVYYPPHHMDILNALNSIDLKEIEKRKQVQELLEKKLNDIGIAMFLSKNLYKDNDTFKWKFNLEVITKKIEIIGEGLSKNELCNKKTLFIKGENSNYIKEKEFYILNEHFPQNKLSIIKNAGHWTHAENYKDFLENVNSFLKD